MASMIVSSEGGLASSLSRRPPLRLLQGVPSDISLVALPRGFPTRFTNIFLSTATPRPCIIVASIHATEPDFYNIPYADGIPVGKRLKLWNLPPNCKHSELLEWFSGVDVVVETLEFTNDPGLNAQGIGGFVEFATKQDACIAIVRLDGYKFRGHYIRMDFAEKRPRPRDYGNRRSRPNRNNGSSTSSSRGISVNSAGASVTDVAPSQGGAAFIKPHSIPRYEVATSSTAQASSDQGRMPTLTNIEPQSSSSCSKGAGNSVTGATQASPMSDFSHSSTGYGDIQSSPVHGTSGTQSSPLYGSIQSSAMGDASYSSGNGHSYIDPFKGYGAPEQAVLEPSSNKTSLHPAPIYGSPQPSRFNRLFVANLAPSVNDATLQQVFSRFGTVLEARVLYEPESGRSRRFGFVAMSSVKEVKAAYDALDGWQLESHPLRLDAVVGT